jgi:hypothetical protein
MQLLSALDLLSAPISRRAALLGLALTLAPGLVNQASAAPAQPAAGQASLSIGGTPLLETPENYLRYIKFLTVDPARQNGAVFQSSDAQAIHRLENPLRRQIFDAMVNNRSDRFQFARLEAAQDDFAMRLEAIKFMNRIGQRGRQGGVDFAYFRADEPAVADPRYWRRLASGPQFYFETVPGVRASDAIDAVVNGKFRGDCYGAIQVTILQSARQVLGADRFNALHPNGLKIAQGGVRQHSRSAPVVAADMVPGDWVYLQNKSDYGTDLTPEGKKALWFWHGENALYMGRYDQMSYNSGAPQRFSGMGCYHRSEDELRQDLKRAYLKDMQPGRTLHSHSITDEDIRWGKVDRLVTGA